MNAGQRRCRCYVSMVFLLMLASGMVLADNPMTTLLDSSIQPGGRQLQTLLAHNVKNEAQEKMRSIGNALLAALTSAFSQASTQLAIEAGKAVVNELSTPPPAPAAPATPTAQVIQLPSPEGATTGIKTVTDTPVDVGSPVTVDTPVKQDSKQIVGDETQSSSSSSKLGHWKQFHERLFGGH